VLESGFATDLDESQASTLVDPYNRTYRVVETCRKQRFHR
jgi:hypothetical protein